MVSTLQSGDANPASKQPRPVNQSIRGVYNASPLPVCVFDVEPDDVIGDLVLVKARVNRMHVGLVLVVPAALVVANGEQLQGVQKNASRNGVARRFR